MATKKVAKKAAAKKTPAKKSAAKKAPAKKTSVKKSAGRKYDPGAGKSVEREMKAMHEGKLKSGAGRR